MPSSKLLTLLACHGLEDFPTHHRGDAAKGLLASLTALWHPLLLAESQGVPGWCRVDQVPQECTAAILIAPSIVQFQIPTGLAQRLTSQQGLLISGSPDRTAIANTALEFCNRNGRAEDPHGLVDDFYALGYAYWQVQLMTRQLRYSSQLDAAHFDRMVTDAARRFAQGDWESTRSGLQAGFDLLMQERNRYFPVDPLLLDLVLVSPATMGAGLDHTLQGAGPFQILVTSEWARQLAQRRPDVLAELQKRVRDGEVELIGGARNEPRLALLSIESLRNQLIRGRAEFKDMLDTVPAVYGRRTFGLTSILPQLLSEFGFRGALHALFDQGQYPAPSVGTMEWQGPDGSTIPTLSITPIDTAQADEFVRLGVSLGEAFDSAHGSAALFARWPGAISSWFDDLRRCGRYANVLGRFVTLSEYFRQAPFSGQRQRYTEDQYRPDWSSEALRSGFADSQQRLTKYWRLRAALTANRALPLMQQLLGPRGNVTQQSVDSGNRLNELEWSIERLTSFDAAGSTDGAQGPEPEALVHELELTRDGIAESIFARLVDPSGRSETVSGSRGDRPDIGPVIAAINPFGFARRLAIRVNGDFGMPQIQKPVYCADIGGDGGYVVLDVPPFGFAVARGTKSLGRARLDGPPVVGEYCLRNEFFELRIDPQTGGIRSVHDYRQRGNLVSQVLGMKLPPGQDFRGASAPAYAQAVADSVEPTITNGVVGEFTSRGTLQSGGRTLAEFQQKIRVIRGRRWFELDMELLPTESPPTDRWRHYYCSRFAWSDEGAELARAVNETRIEGAPPRFEAPQYVEIINGMSRLALLTNGLVHHRFYDYRKLDCLLPVSETKPLRWSMGVGVDLPSAQQAAIDIASAAIVWQGTGALRLPQPSAWLMRVDSRHLVFVGIEPPGTGSFGDGVRLRLKETDGRAGEARLEAARPITAARRLRLDGSDHSSLAVADGSVTFGFAAGEYLQIELAW